MPKKKAILPKELTTVTRVSKLLALFLFVALPILAFYIGTHYGGIFELKSEPQLPQKITYEQYNNEPQEPINNWSTYSNKEYGFSVQYPSSGYVQEATCAKGGECNFLHLAACGADTKQTKLGDYPMISLDNFFSVLVIPHTGSIESYISNVGGNVNYTTEPVTIKGADEAVFISAYKSTTDDIPSLPPPMYLIKKGNNIFQIAPFQDAGSANGCLPPVGTKSNIFDSKYWNIPKSISFN